MPILSQRGHKWKSMKAMANMKPRNRKKASFPRGFGMFQE